MKFKKDDYVEFYDSGQWLNGKVVFICGFPERIIIVSKLGEENSDRYYAFKENSKDIRSMTIVQSIKPPYEENPTNKLLSEILDELKAIRSKVGYDWWKPYDWWRPYTITTTGKDWRDYQPQWYKHDWSHVYCNKDDDTVSTLTSDTDNSTLSVSVGDECTHTYRKNDNNCAYNDVLSDLKQCNKEKFKV